MFGLILKMMYFNSRAVEASLLAIIALTPVVTSTAFPNKRYSPFPNGKHIPTRTIQQRQVALVAQNPYDTILAATPTPGGVFVGVTGPPGMRVYEEPLQAGQFNLASLYTWDFAWRNVWYNITDPSKRTPPPSKIPLHQDGNCLAALVDNNGNTYGKARVRVRSIQSTALPKIQQNSGQAGGMVGNNNFTDCTSLYTDRTMTINYCGVGSVTFDSFNASMQMLIGNCTQTAKVAGSIWLQGADRPKYNWIQFW